MGAAKAHHRAEVNRVIRGGQNLAEAALTIGGGTRGREIPKGSRHVRNSVSSFMQNFAKVRVSEIRRLRYVGKSHVACLLIMFTRGRLAMPCMRRENVRHATLLFRAKSGEPR